MGEKLYGADDILKKFKGVDKALDNLWCALDKCCAKSPINIGEGLGLYKQFYNGKWEFKSIFAGSGISFTDTGEEIVINADAQPFDCQDVLDCLEISESGNPNKFLNEQGDWVFVSGSGFTCSELSNCSTTNLPEGSNLYFTDARAITALTGQNISIFNNDVPYLTSSTIPLTSTQIAFGDGSNFMTSSNSLTFDSSSVKIDTNGSSSGWGQTSLIVSSPSSEAGFTLSNTGTGGHDFNLISTSAASGIGGGKFSIGDATTSQNIFEYSSSTNLYTLPLLGGSGTLYVTTDNNGVLGTASAPTPSLTENYVGVGDASNQLSGSANFIFDYTGELMHIAFASGDLFRADVGNSYLQIAEVSGGGSLLFPSFGEFRVYTAGNISFSLNDNNSNYSIGALGFGNGTNILVDDSGNRNITLNADNGVIVTNLTGTGTQMVVADINGLLSKQAIPSSSPVTSIADTTSIDLDISLGVLTANLILADGGTF